MKNAERSFWESELYNREHDLIIVGAGLTGQSIAYFYKQNHPDEKVLVIDRGFYPIGASTRNAGFACFGSVTEHMADMEIEEEAKIIDRIRRRFNGLQLLRQTLGDENIDYREPGAFEIFTDDEVFQKAVAQLDIVNRWLVEAAGKEDVYEITEINGFPAISIRHEGCLHPGKMMRTLYEKNLEQGVEFRWQSQVQNIDEASGVVNLGNDVQLKASQLAIATNSFTSSLLKEVDIKPGRGFVFVTKPIPDFKWKGTFHYDGGYYYFREVGENQLLLGGARSLDIDVETTIEFGTNEKIKNHLISFANNVLKLPEGWGVEKEWSGIMGFTSTKSPILKRISEKAIVVAGLSGMGVALGMQLGKEASELVRK
ncbi:MAG: FAD-binding oxidoreductase [Gracilimonas sp.]|uniref:NAD(P)/FAD-dependent oxidoreductase n=1 Tax=Gracilimonas sp. TaxID=1974203 RepID=UPI001998276A|nr:FAD-dependent oxidoreductase [Gracilimonas sp.]MBD3616484.1 FAD-binding oxidoreductase [Gracilimonas sp.]